MQLPWPYAGLNQHIWGQTPQVTDPTRPRIDIWEPLAAAGQVRLRTTIKQGRPKDTAVSLQQERSSEEQHREGHRSHRVRSRQRDGPRWANSVCASAGGEGRVPTPRPEFPGPRVTKGRS